MIEIRSEEGYYVTYQYSEIASEDVCIRTWSYTSDEVNNDKCLTNSLSHQDLS